MSLFDRLFRKKEAELPQKKSYDSQDLQRIVSSKSVDMENSFKTAAAGKYSEIVSLVKDIELKLGEFDRHRIDSERIDPRSFQMLIGNKKVIFARVHEMCAVLGADMGEDADTIIKYYGRSRSKIIETVYNTVENYKKIEQFFESTLDPIMRSVNKVASVIESFQPEINSFQKENEAIASIKASMERMEKMILEKDAMYQRRAVAEKKLLGLGAQMDDSKKRLSDILSSENYRKFLKRVDTRDEIKSRLDDNMAMVISNISPFSRAVKKFLKLVEDGEVEYKDSYELMDIMENYTMNDRTVPVVKNAFTKMHSVMDRLNLKEDIAKKVDKKIVDVLGSNTLEHIYQLRLTLLRELELAESMVSLNTPPEKYDVEMMLDGLNSNINSVTADLNELVQNLENTDKMIEELKQEITLTFKEIIDDEFTIR